jgi:predicted dinucleotide-binding enzyme
MQEGYGYEDRVVGAGAIDGAIAKLAVDQGHQVMISSRHPDTPVALAERIGCNMGTVDAAAQFGDLIVVAIALKDLDSLPIREKFRGFDHDMDTKHIATEF